MTRGMKKVKVICPPENPLVCRRLAPSRSRNSLSNRNCTPMPRFRARPCARVAAWSYVSTPCSLPSTNPWASLPALCSPNQSWDPWRRYPSPTHAPHPTSPAPSWALAPKGYTSGARPPHATDTGDGSTPGGQLVDTPQVHCLGGLDLLVNFVVMLKKMALFGEIYTNCYFLKGSFHFFASLYLYNIWYVSVLSFHMYFYTDQDLLSW